MNKFGLKAFLRAVAIFISIYLVKIGIELVIRTPDIFQKIIYSIVIIFIVLLIIIVPNILITVRREEPNRDRKIDDEN